MCAEFFKCGCVLQSDRFTVNNGLILSATWIPAHDATEKLKLFYLYGNREGSLLLAASISLSYESVLDRFMYSISDYRQHGEKGELASSFHWIF